MKFPKNRATVFAVMRDDVLIGVFADLQEADDFAGACFQEWMDKVQNYGVEVKFKVTATTFYG